MVNLIFILSLLVIWHFIYDGIILPTIRLNLRYKLFILRDRIRVIKTEKQDKIDNEVFHYLNNSINVSIKYMTSFNIPLAIKANREIAKKPELQKKLAHDTKAVMDCKEKEVRDIYRKSLEYSSFAFIANSGTWLLYLSGILIPVLILLIVASLILKGIVSPIKKHWKSIIENISFTPEHEFQRIFGEHISNTHTELAGVC